MFLSSCWLQVKMTFIKTIPLLLNFSATTTNLRSFQLFQHFLFNFSRFFFGHRLGKWSGSNKKIKTRMWVYCGKIINHLPVHILKTINKRECCINQFKVLAFRGKWCLLTAFWQVMETFLCRWKWLCACDLINVHLITHCCWWIQAQQTNFVTQL
jgi:hypothetical protein